ncbi:hypothetical protein SAMN06265219_109128 [Gracilimonas mengyeensis]|uniref:Uncharacterized protein n=1 Tax=Gracilimonas mengyeensis TaxID=1302730 RepID=A0A521DUY4_9BACT|nr:hypothetical protein SAMN06265219_109128 [Gracilimonas mengyeensis]
MEIDFATIVISLIAIAFFVVPITYDQMKKKKDHDEQN